jgi:ArsR family transcriptional regulator, arsenate/arsenite/antimonite-responsive transcriptional repressor
LRSRARGGTIKSMGVDLNPAASSSADSRAIACCAPLAGPTLSDEEAAATARLFGALGEPARVRIVNLLATAGDPVSVCELIEPLGLSQGTVSHHLKRLTDVGLLDREERGKWTYFSINADAMTRLSSLLDLPREAAC